MEKCWQKSVQFLVSNANETIFRICDALQIFPERKTYFFKKGTQQLNTCNFDDSQLRILSNADRNDLDTHFLHRFGRDEGTFARARIPVSIADQENEF